MEENIKTRHTAIRIAILGIIIFIFVSLSQAVGGADEGFVLEDAAGGHHREDDIHQRQRSPDRQVPVGTREDLAIDRFVTLHHESGIKSYQSVVTQAQDDINNAQTRLQQTTTEKENDQKSQKRNRQRHDRQRPLAESQKTDILGAIWHQKLNRREKAQQSAKDNYQQKVEGLNTLKHCF